MPDAGPPQRQGRSGGTGLACLVFTVAGGGPRTLAVLGAGTLISRQAVLGMQRQRENRRRKRLLAGAAAYHILVLLAFKYTGFLTGGRWVHRLGAAGAELFHL